MIKAEKKKIFWSLEELLMMLIMSSEIKAILSIFLE